MKRNVQVFPYHILQYRHLSISFSVIRHGSMANLFRPWNRESIRDGDVKQAIFININLFRSNAKHANQTLRLI